MKTALRIVALVLLTVLCVLLVWLNIESIKNSLNYLDYLEEMIENGVYEENDVVNERRMRIVTIIYSILNVVYQFIINVAIAIFIINPYIFVRKLKSMLEKCNDKSKDGKIEKKISKLQAKLNKYKESE